MKMKKVNKGGTVVKESIMKLEQAITPYSVTTTLKADTSAHDKNICILLALMDSLHSAGHISMGGYGAIMEHMCELFGFDCLAPEDPEEVKEMLKKMIKENEPNSSLH